MILIQYGQLKSKFLTTVCRALPQYVLVSVLVIGLCGCSTSVKTYNSQWPDSAAEMLSCDSKRDENKLENLSVAALIQKGNAVPAQGNEQLARMYYAMAIKKDPDSVEALVGMGKLLYRNRAFEPARKVYEQVLERAPDHHLAVLSLARIDRIQGNDIDALNRLKERIDEFNDDAEFLSEMAMIYDNLGLVDDAKPLYQQVVQLQPKQASSHNNLGFNSLLRSDYPAAILSFRRALTLEPGNVWSQNNLAIAYALSGREEQAIQLFTSAADKAVAYNNIGYLHMANGEWDKAEKSFKNALELKPSFYVKAQQNLDQLNRMRMLESP